MREDFLLYGQSAQTNLTEPFGQCYFLNGDAAVASFGRVGVAAIVMGRPSKWPQ
jgi:hypothetical protein